MKLLKHLWKVVVVVLVLAGCEEAAPPRPTTPAASEPTAPAEPTPAPEPTTPSEPVRVGVGDWRITVGGRLQAAVIDGRYYEGRTDRGPAVEADGVAVSMPQANMEIRTNGDYCASASAGGGCLGSAARDDGNVSKDELPTTACLRVCPVTRVVVCLAEGGTVESTCRQPTPPAQPAVEPVTPSWIRGTWTHPSAFYKSVRFTSTAIILTRADNNRSFSITRRYLVYREDTGDTFTVALWQNTESGPQRFIMVFAISDDRSNILFLLDGPGGRVSWFYSKA